MRCSPSLSVAVIVAAMMAGCIAALAQLPDYHGVGKPPTQEEIRRWDIAIGLDGKELPPGSGTAKQGEPIYASKCAACHGRNLEGVPMPGLPPPPDVPPVPLAGGRGMVNTPRQIRTVGSW